MRKRTVLGLLLAAEMALLSALSSSSSPTAPPERSRVSYAMSGPPSILASAIASTPSEVIGPDAPPARVTLDLSPKQRLQDIVDAYPDHIKRAEKNAIIWKDGTRTRYDDGKKKTKKQLMASPDLEDMMREPYPLYFGEREPQNDGAIYQQFFKKMYGSSKNQVGRRLVRIRWMPKSCDRALYVTRVNGVDEKVRRISAALDELPQEMKKYVIGSQSFNYRLIYNSKNLSLHSYGIAIDIDPDHGRYWGRGDEYANDVPKEIVDIFEREGFIHGARRHMYDTMHFEYRPELLMQKLRTMEADSSTDIK